MSEIIHKEFLQAYLNGIPVRIRTPKASRWTEFNPTDFSLDCFNTPEYKFKLKTLFDEGDIIYFPIDPESKYQVLATNYHNDPHKYLLLQLSTRLDYIFSEENLELRGVIKVS